MRVRSWLRRLLQNVSARQVAFTFIAQLTGLVISVGTAAITARWLGPEGRGELAMLLLVPGLIGLFLGLGTTGANVYFSASRRLGVDQISSHSVSFALLASAAGGALVALALATDLLQLLVPGISTPLLLLAMLALPLGLLSGNLRSILHGLGQFRALNVLSVSQSLGSLALMALCLIGFGLGVPGALLATLAVQLGALFFIAWLVLRHGAILRPRWDPRVVSPMLNYGLKNYVGDLLQFFNYRLDAFIVNFFLGPVSVGIYGASVVLAELLWQLPNAAAFVLFPKAASSDPEVMTRLTWRAVVAVLVITTLGAVGLGVFGELIIRIIFSSAFLEAYVPLLVLLPGVVLLGTVKVLGSDLAGRGYPHYNSIIAGISLVVTVVLDFLLIPRYGVVGAALASTSSYLMSFVLSVGVYAKVSRRSPNPGKAGGR